MKKPGGEEVTEYEIRPTPPLLKGASHSTRAFPVPAVATTFRGGVGGPMGVISGEESLGKEVRVRLLARTVNVYGVPFIRPATRSVVELSGVP
jgi:hypothetical protein